MNREKSYKTAMRMKKYYGPNPGSSIQRMPNMRKISFMKIYNNAANTIKRSFARKKKMNEAKAIKERNAKKVILTALQHYLYKPGGSRYKTAKAHFNSTSR